jgi:hypothetical protein
MARKPRKQAADQTKKPRWQIESPTRGIYVGAPYAERSRDWPLFTWSPDPARIIRFDDKAEAEAELTRVQSFAANARLREVD